jgi:hypothetical protein
MLFLSGFYERLSHHINAWLYTLYNHWMKIEELNLNNS